MTTMNRQQAVEVLEQEARLYRESLNPFSSPAYRASVERKMAALDLAIAALQAQGEPVAWGPMFGRMDSADFEADTVTFQMEPGYYAAAGRYRIERIGLNELSGNSGQLPPPAPKPDAVAGLVGQWRSSAARFNAIGSQIANIHAGVMTACADELAALNPKE